MYSNAIASEDQPLISENGSHFLMKINAIEIND